MVRSVRLDPQLERRLAQAAEAEGVSVSAFLRKAVARRCDEVLGRNLAEDLAAVTGVIESTGGRARQTGRAFAALLGSRAGA